MSKWGRVTSWPLCKFVDVCFVCYRQFRVQGQSDMRIVILWELTAHKSVLSVLPNQQRPRKNLSCSSQRTSAIVIEGNESILNVPEGLTPD